MFPLESFGAKKKLGGAEKIISEYLFNFLDNDT
jgi:hypothetical protein